MCAMLKRAIDVDPTDKIQDRSYVTREEELRLEIDYLDGLIEERGGISYLGLAREFTMRREDLQAELDMLEKEAYSRQLTDQK